MLTGTAWGSVRADEMLLGCKMPEDQRCKAEEIALELIKEGWEIQKSGISYLNGNLGTNLYKDGEVLMIQQSFYPNEEFIEQEWPEELK